MHNAIKLAPIAAALLLSSALIIAPAADAQTRAREVTVSNSQGRTATSNTAVTRQEGSVQKDRSVQTGAGYGYSKSTTAGYDDETGTRNRSSSVTTNSGATVSGGSSASCVDGSCSRSGSVTGPNGETVARDTVRYVDETGQYVKDTTVTGPEGEQASRNVVRDGEGIKTTTTTSPDGTTRSRTRWIAVD